MTFVVQSSNKIRKNFIGFIFANSAIEAIAIAGKKYAKEGERLHISSCSKEPKQKIKGVMDYAGPKLIRDKNGNVVIWFTQVLDFDDYGDFNGEWVAHAFGLGREAIGESLSLQDLAARAEQRFSGKVVIKDGEKINPKNWSEAEW